MSAFKSYVTSTLRLALKRHEVVLTRCWQPSQAGPVRLHVLFLVRHCWGQGAGSVSLRQVIAFELRAGREGRGPHQAGDRSTTRHSGAWGASL